MLQPTVLNVAVFFTLLLYVVLILQSQLLNSVDIDISQELPPTIPTRAVGRYAEPPLGGDSGNQCTSHGIYFKSYDESTGVIKIDLPSPGWDIGKVTFDDVNGILTICARSPNPGAIFPSVIKNAQYQVSSKRIGNVKQIILPTGKVLWTKRDKQIPTDGESDELVAQR